MLTISFRRQVFPACFDAIDNSNRSHKAFGSLGRKPFPCVFFFWSFASCFWRFASFFCHSASCFCSYECFSQIGCMKFAHLYPWPWLFPAGFCGFFRFIIAPVLLIMFFIIYQIVIIMNARFWLILNNELPKTSGSLVSFSINKQIAILINYNPFPTHEIFSFFSSYSKRFVSPPPFC